jgi:D-beta-D-heptose 7-phosphate kinase/D-beta-D-heptose 1-phosphate adenosyltransferase
MSAHLEKIEQKIVNLTNLLKLCHNFRSHGKTIAFTNGCFDILHKGHATYLSKAADLADVLVVGINADASVKRQGKGENRPINDENARSFLLASLESVDYVVLFSEDTPHLLIQQIIPDVLVKGGDYDPLNRDKDSKSYIVGADIVVENGGKVISIPLVNGFSTSNIVKSIQKGK